MSSATTPVVSERLDAAEAQRRGLVPTGMVWDEDAQAPEPRGMAIERAALERPVDLKRNLETWKQNRETLLAFIRDRLQEADYRDNKYPVAGAMHDYYILPGYDKKALTKQGAEKLAQLFRFARASTETVQREVTKEHTMAVVRVVLRDQYRREVGSGEAACSTAESSFRGERNAKKYAGDYRAALNDVIARAGKRAFVQAVIYAVAGDEIFDAHEGQDDDDQKKATSTEAAVTATPRRMPAKIKTPGFANLAGKLMAEVETPRLVDVLNWCRTNVPGGAAAKLIGEIEEELDSRRSDETEVL